MKLCEGWTSFIKEIRETKLPIVCFGSGSLPWLAEPLLTKLSVWDRILYFLDNDESKSGTCIGEERKIPILSVPQFQSRKQERFILLITCETFAPVLEQLQQIEEWKDIHCYLYIRLNHELLKMPREAFFSLFEIPQVIPRVIHYCWFGHGEKKELYQRCIQGWRELCPDYEIIEWNESNYDIHQCQYMEEAYASGKWAYVTDYARLDILYRYGGIYLDADVELLKRPDSLLYEKGFIAYGQWSAANSGAGMGCVKGLPIVREMRDEPRASISFYRADGSCNTLQNGFYESRILRKYGFKQDFRQQSVGDLLILPPEVMATASILGERVFVTKDTISIHHCGGSWASQRTLLERKQTADVC